MPASRLPFNGIEAGVSSSSVDYFSYEQPPGPDKRRNSKEAYLPSKRRSWADVVDQCSEQSTERISTVTDVSSLDSRSLANLDTLAVPNGARRRSWEQLIEENEENGQIECNPATHSSLPLPPLPTLPLPYANPALHLMTVRDDGRLARVHLYNKKRSSTDSNSRTATDMGISLKTDGSRKESCSGSSKTSTMSEFILVPSKTALTSSSSSSITDDDSRRFRHDFGKAKRSPMGFLCPWTLSRRTTFVMILTAVLLLTTAVGGYVLRRFIIGRRTIYELTYPASEEYETRFRGALSQQSDRSPTTLRVVANEPSSAEFRLNGVFPYQDVRTVVDFDKKLVISRHHSGGWSTYCFISHLNESAFPSIDTLREAAENALSKKRPVSWLEDWQWQLEPVSDNLRDHLYFDSESREQCGRNLYWLQRVDRDMSAAKCVECYPVCLPSYGVTRLGVDHGRPLLAPTGRDCFWMSSTSSTASNQVSPVARTFVNNHNGNTYSYGTNFVGPSFTQQQPPTAFRPFGQPQFQNSPTGYPYQRQYQQNVFYNPSWPQNGPGGFISRS